MPLSRLRPRSPLPLGVARGVTLLEMMIVVAMIGIIAAIAVPNLSPVINTQKVAASSEQVANLLDRARRKSIATGYCHRVRLAGDNLALERRTSINCVNLDTTNWSTPLGYATPELGVSFSIEGAPGTPAAPNQLVFRPNGRLYGDGDWQIEDDGARVLVVHGSSTTTNEVRVTANGRNCTLNYKGTKPMPDPVTCGLGYGGAGGGTPSGGSCDTAGGGKELPSFAGALLLLGALRARRGRRPRRARATDAKRHRARGYLLLEVMASGVILATILAVAVTQVAQFRRDTAVASRRAQAASYAQQALAWVIAQPTTATPTCPPAAFEPPEPFNLSCDVQPITPVSTPALEDPMFEVIVSVTYPAINPPGSTATTTHHARIRSRNRVYTLN